LGACSQPALKSESGRFSIVTGLVVRGVLFSREEFSIMLGVKVSQIHRRIYSID
jgi:hypothetical protein